MVYPGCCASGLVVIVGLLLAPFPYKVNDMGPFPVIIRVGFLTR